ncbi:MAG: twin-arginine translocation signal domain-containing protein, partial [Verrucomicrobia bacterium]|nr:twin-arginine translocation signal domain-containing protein [Verrucomicrobiota bacterium]
MSSQRTYFQSESPAWTRRSFLTRSGLGFGGLALGTMLARDGFGLES